MVKPKGEISVEGALPGGCGSCGIGQLVAESTRCGNGLEKIYPTTAVRFGFLRYIGEFSHVPDLKFTCGAKVVIQTQRGIEIGEQVSLSCSGCDKSVTRERMKEWVAACGEDSFIFEAGRILREATTGDLAENAHIQADCRKKRAFAQAIADTHKLPIQIVECEHLFGGERIIFFFTSKERVDFRAVVKELAREYRTRIEMRQIGARDEARVLADYETCGREVCCKVFLKTLKPISMRMAKLQKATLDPSQVSGRCGRLKCCLRYEHDGYEDLDKRLPKIGTRVATVHGDGVIVNRQVLTQLVQVRMDSDKVVTVVFEDVTGVGIAAKAPLATQESDRESRRAGQDRRGGRQRPRAQDRKSRAPRSSAPAEGDSTVGDPTAEGGDRRPESGQVSSANDSGAKDSDESQSDPGTTAGAQSPPDKQRGRRPRRRRGRQRGDRRPPTPPDQENP